MQVTNNGTGAGSGIQIQPGAIISANGNGATLATGGNVLIQASDSANGFITVGNGVRITALGPASGSQGQIQLTVGSSSAQVSGTTPADTFVTNNGATQVFFGTNPVATVPASNTIITTGPGAGNGFDVSFTSGSANQIALGGNVQINTGAFNPARPGSVWQVWILLIHKPRH